MINNNYFTFDADAQSVTFEMNVADRGYTVNGRRVTAIALYADAEYTGDLAVCWEAEDDSDYVDNTTMLMRDIRDTNVNTETMSLFYWEKEFNAQLCALLEEAGFSDDAIADVCGSEWGMQDVGRASYDACVCGEEMLAQHNITQEA
jgi:hypothetical protein